jgi:hypothetical protein
MFKMFTVMGCPHKYWLLYSVPCIALIVFSLKLQTALVLLCPCNLVGGLHAHGSELYTKA